LEGAVLIGDIPEPEMFQDNRYEKGGEVYPVDYYYMDVWDTIGDTGFTVDTVLWKFPAWDDTTIVSGKPPYDTLPYFDVSYEVTNGDEHMEIWVSRIYAKKINLLRDSSFVYDSINDPRFPDNHEIISNYLDRVHERMTQRAKVPPRAFGMGHISSTYGYADTALYWLKQSLPFDSLNLFSTRYFIKPDTASPENTPSNWQSQLQAGPYGNVNMGAFKGMRFDSLVNAQDKRYTQFRNDTRGYEWAGIFEHSGAGSHWFNQVGHLALPGRFYTVPYFPLWEKDTSAEGYKDGTYYTYRNRYKLTNLGLQPDKIAWWSTDTIRTAGDYAVYMWYFQSPSNDSCNYANICVNGHVVSGRWMNMRGNSSGQWHVIDDTVSIGSNSVVTVELSANYTSTDIINDASIADAVKLVNLNVPGDSIVIDNSDPGFVRLDSLNRSFYSFRDEGGPSKTPFYLLQACHINCYTADDCLGLVYAMGHNGLISIGSSNANGGFKENPSYQPRFEYKYFIEALNKGLNFGEAFLYMSNNYSPGILGGIHGNDKFILCGAGTLKAQAYHPYSDCMFLLINNADITTIESHFVEQIVTINGIMGSSTTVHSGGGLSITAGDDIVILPEFHAEYGSEMLLKINPSLKD